MKIEIRSANEAVITGYVNAVGRDSRPIISEKDGKLVEMIEPGTFDAALKRATNVDLLLNHKHTRKLGSTADGNLTLKEDSIGLRAECLVKDAETIEKARKGELRGWSFGMYINDAQLEERAGDLPRRHVRSLDLFEVSIIDSAMLPCYNGTSIECRAESDKFLDMRAVADEATVEEAAAPPDYKEWEDKLETFRAREAIEQWEERIAALTTTDMKAVM